jgi:anti-sigma B factor antagonist
MGEVYQDLPEARDHHEPETRNQKQETFFRFVVRLSGDPMLVEFEQRGDICILRLHGRFATGQDSAYLRAKTDEIKSAGYSKVLADFSQVSYIDSTGIGFLIGIYTSILKNASGRFVLANLNRRVRDVLELTRLANVIPIYPTEDAALEALEAGEKSSAGQAT